VGDGTVEFAGRQNGYGNVVQLRHSNDRTTLYAHLSRIDVREGQRVEQGQRIGAVGATGWATGPHLHFEFRRRGEHLDPLKVAKASEAVTIDPASRPRLLEHARSAKLQLEVAASMTGADTVGE
jgi:murein DD-endopeptidase MepM/ murein hydrolase activator NlpD